MKTALIRPGNFSSLFPEIGFNVRAFRKLRSSKNRPVLCPGFQSHALHSFIAGIPSGHLEHIRLIPDGLVPGNPLKKQIAPVFVRFAVEIHQSLHLLIGGRISQGFSKSFQKLSQISLPPGRHIGRRHGGLALQKPCIHGSLQLIPDLKADSVCGGPVFVITGLGKGCADNPEDPAVPDLPSFRISFFPCPVFFAGLKIRFQLL